MDYVAATGDKPITENTDFAKMVGRMIRAMGKRAAADVDAIPLLAKLADDLDGAQAHAVRAALDEGYSLNDVAQRLGTTRQAVHKRWSRAGR